MGTFLVKLTHPDTGETCIIDWSTVFDRPRSRAIPLESLRDYMRVETACTPLTGRYCEELAQRERRGRLSRLAAQGCSAYGVTPEDVIGNNRAGPDESCLNERELFEQATRAPATQNLLLRGLLVDLLEVATNWNVDDVIAPLAAKLHDELGALADIDQHLGGELSYHSELIASLKTKAEQLRALGGEST